MSNSWKNQTLGLNEGPTNKGLKDRNFTKRLPGSSSIESFSFHVDIHNDSFYPSLAVSGALDKIDNWLQFDSWDLLRDNLTKEDFMRTFASKLFQTSSRLNFIATMSEDGVKYKLITGVYSMKLKKIKSIIQSEKFLKSKLRMVYSTEKSGETIRTVEITKVEGDFFEAISSEGRKRYRFDRVLQIFKAPEFSEVYRVLVDVLTINSSTTVSYRVERL